jgi:hypothetical protein
LNRSSLSHLAAIAAAIASVALTGCDGNVAVADAPARTPSAEPRRDVAVQRATAGDAEERARDTGRGVRERKLTGDERAVEVAGGDDGATMDDSEADPQLVAIVRSKTIDLEFTHELPEPPQDAIVPGPARWTPDPAASEHMNPVIEDVWPAKAPASGGDKVVIRGKNLEAAQVLFGVAPAQIVEAAEDHITVAAPSADAGLVAIVVTNRDGNYALAGGAFHYDS